MNGINQLVAESAATKSNEINSAITCRIFSCYDIWWDIFAEAASTLYHYISSDMAELVGEYHCTDDGIVINCYFTGEFRRVTNDESVTQDAVVSHMHILHQKVVAAYHSF